MRDFCCCCCCCCSRSSEPAPDPFLAGAVGLGFVAGDPLRYSRLLEEDDVTCDCDVICVLPPLSDDFAKVDFEKVVFSGDLLRRSSESVTVSVECFNFTVFSITFKMGGGREH